MDPRVVEHAELILHEPIEVAPSEPVGVDVNLLKRTEEHVARYASAVLGIGPRRGGRRCRGGGAPLVPPVPAVPDAVQRHAVAAPAVFPGGAETVRQRARWWLERGRRRPISYIGVEAELVAQRRLL